MLFSVVHELPKRIRIQLHVSRKHGLDSQYLEASCLSIQGIEKAQCNPRRNTLLVVYTGESPCKDSLLSTLENFSILTSKALEPDCQTGKPIPKKLIFKGGMLLIGSLIPRPIRIALSVTGALPVLKQALKALSTKRLNAEVLDGASIAVAMGMRDFQTVSVISFLLQAGDYLEEWAKHKSQQNLAAMLDVCTEWVWIIQEGKESRIPFTQLQIDDQVVVRAGSAIPVDGLVTEGEATVNQASMTGEPLGVAKRRGSPVYAGTVLEEGKLIIRATEVGQATKISKIVQTIEESEDLKAAVQNQAELLADKLVPYSFLLSAVTFLITGNASKAAAALLVDFSCAIKLATPLSVMSYMMKASKQGALIKGGKYMEILSQSDVFLFDKTGTLTEGRPKITEIVPLNGYDREFLLRNVACVEEHFPHPVATAIVRKAEEEGLTHEENHSEVKHIVAHGIESMIDGKLIVVGSRHFVEEDRGIDLTIAEDQIREFLEDGSSILYIGIGGKIAGLVAFDDPIREESKEVLNILRNHYQKRVIMLTGDHHAPASKVAKALGITEYRAQIFPHEKLEVVKQLQKEGNRVVMIGDGINDSPALSMADIGVSLQSASDLAKETSNLLLLDDNLHALTGALQLSEDCMGRIKQNYRYIIGINSSLILFGVFGLIPPVLSAFAHNATTLVVAANALK